MRGVTTKKNLHIQHILQTDRHGRNGVGAFEAFSRITWCNFISTPSHIKRELVASTHSVRTYVRTWSLINSTYMYILMITALLCGLQDLLVTEKQLSHFHFGTQIPRVGLPLGGELNDDFNLIIVRCWNWKAFFDFVLDGLFLLGNLSKVCLHFHLVFLKFSVLLGSISSPASDTEHIFKKLSILVVLILGNAA